MDAVTNTNMNITGTVVYLERYIGEVMAKFPYLYVNRNEIYDLTDSKGGETFEPYDGKRVKIYGNIWINNETKTKIITSFEISEIQV